MISPVILYNLVLTVIGLMQYFILPYIISNQTRSNPETNFINLHLYARASCTSTWGMRQPWPGSCSPWR
jgi:ABC-type sugar transport system permease subunit